MPVTVIAAKDYLQTALFKLGIAKSKRSVAQDTLLWSLLCDVETEIGRAITKMEGRV
jgi:hypothetical protein